MRGLAERGTLYEYATGRIVLWTSKDSGVDVQRWACGILASPRFGDIAIANPEHAPYGRAAVAALQHESLYEELRTKLVLGENISQAAQFVQSGNAEVGILALSLALSSRPQERRHATYEIPDDWYPPIRQGGRRPRELHGRKKPRSQFLAFLQSDPRSHDGFSRQRWISRSKTVDRSTSHGLARHLAQRQARRPL